MESLVIIGESNVTELIKQFENQWEHIAYQVKMWEIRWSLTQTDIEKGAKEYV